MPITLPELRQLLKEQPLLASVQASPGPVDNPSILLKLALASIANGCKVIRLQGSANIEHVRPSLGGKTPVVGLIKEVYPTSEIFITPTSKEVNECLRLGVEVIALDGSPRSRPSGEDLESLVKIIHAGGALAMADCDCPDSAAYAIGAGCDIIGTTLAGYTPARPAIPGPDLDFVREAVALAKPGGQLVIGEGRYSAPWQCRCAMWIGADAVTLGGSLNDPVKQTILYSRALAKPADSVGAVDLGGTWLRFAVFSPSLELLSLEKVELPTTREERLAWIRVMISKTGVTRLGVSAGGVIDPVTKTITSAKVMGRIGPDHIGTQFEFEGVNTVALNDGHATAWGHAMHPDFAGKRVATIALGTGVGCGCVDRGEILMSPSGDYPRLNDLTTAGGKNFEELLGGAALSPHPTAQQMAEAQQAADSAVAIVKNIMLPDVIVRCGGVGLCDWIKLPGTVATPHGSEAGLVGAACLALYPPPISNVPGEHLVPTFGNDADEASSL